MPDQTTLADLVEPVREALRLQRHGLAVQRRIFIVALVVVVMHVVLTGWVLVKIEHHMSKLDDLFMIGDYNRAALLKMHPLLMQLVEAKPGEILAAPPAGGGGKP